MMPVTRSALVLVFLLIFSCGGTFALGQSALQRALEAIERGDYREAELLLGDDPQHLALKGILEFHRGRYDEARATLEKALETADTFHVRVFLGLARAATGRCQDAIEALKEEFQDGKPSALHRQAGLALVQCQMLAGLLGEAFPILEHLSALYPDHPDVLYQRARFHMRAWNHVISEMFEKAPASFRVNQLSAEILETQGRFSEAVTEYRKAIEKNPQALGLHFRLGRGLLMGSHSPESLEEARKEFEAELLLNPNDATAEYQIGQILLVQQRHAEAARHFERTLMLSPDFPDALLALGKLRMEANRYDEAIQLLEKAVRLLPESETAHYSLMIAYRNAGRGEEAMREKEQLEKLQQEPEGEFKEFLKKLGEKSGKP